MELLAAAQGGDDRAFEALVGPHRRELQAHCYRMLGSIEDARDAVQETVIAAWRGLSGFQQRSTLRTWLYRIATRCCLRMAGTRPRRMLSSDHGPARSPRDDLGLPVTEPIWLQPWPEQQPDDAGADPAERYARTESVELAFVAALQHLPPNQRAVLILRDVLAFSAAETAELLGTSTPSVNSALQRARRTMAARDAAGPAAVQDREQRTLIRRFVTAFESGDVPALVRLLSRDVQFTMPPLPAWFDGRDDVAGFFAERVFATPWRARMTAANGGPAIAGYQQRNGTFRLSSLLIPRMSGGSIDRIASFLDPAVLAGFDLPETI